MDANRTNPAYALKSELARYCLPGAKREPDCKLAWVNSICILFLLIGVIGTKRAVIAMKAPPPIREEVAVLIEQVTPPPVTQIQPTEEQNEQKTESETPQVVVVTPDSPAVVFSVPTVGNVLTSSAVAQPPPINPLKPVAPVSEVPQILNNTGQGGERPRPDYPKIAQDQNMQGTVVLAMTVDDKGTITQITVKESSGFPLLDRSALDHVKKRWIIPPGVGTRHFEVPIHYKLKAN